MDRREFFLNTAKASGVMLPWWYMQPLANAQSSAKKLVVFVHMNGGPKTDLWVDPQINNALNLYSQAGTAVPRIGNIAVAPISTHQQFFTQYGSRCLIVNGVNTQTNAHDQGSMRFMTGKLEMGYAPLCEMYAAKHGVGEPVAWMSAGGYDTSAGLTVATPGPDGNQLRALIEPNAASATTTHIKRADYDKVVATRDARLQALKASGTMLPKESLITEQWIRGKEARARLAAVAENIPATFGQFPDIEVGMIAMQSGITTAFQWDTGGFDCHGSVLDYEGANGAMTRLNARLDYMLQEAGRRGIADRLFTVVGGEFNRTALNQSNGADHNNVGASYLIIGPPSWSLGNRTFGWSGPMQAERAVNRMTGAPIMPGVSDPNAVVLRSNHVHAALHKYLDIAPPPALAMGVPANEEINLFSASAVTGHPTLT